MPQLSTIAYATQALTFTGQALNTETAVIGGRTYTFQDTLTDSDGNVHIGADAENDILNLTGAITLTSGTAGTDYAASMTVNADVTAVATSATVLTITARIPGTISNYIATTETLTNASWGAATMASGSGSIATAISEIVAEGQVNSDLLLALSKID